MSIIQQRNNNKAFPNLFAGIQLAGGGQTVITYYCYNCKVFFNHPSTGGTAFKDHLTNTHGFVDSG